MKRCTLAARRHRRCNALRGDWPLSHVGGMHMALQKDKVAHLGVGALIAALAGTIVPPAAALAIVVLVAWEKESYDKGHPEAHTFDGWDAFATLVGGVVWVLASDVWSQVMGVL